jgi:hypothetical protein
MRFLGDCDNPNPRRWSGPADYDWLDAAGPTNPRHAFHPSNPLTWVNAREPESGIEPLTYALREGHVPFGPVWAPQVTLNYMPVIMVKGG